MPGHGLVASINEVHARVLQALPQYTLRKLCGKHSFELGTVRVHGSAFFAMIIQSKTLRCESHVGAKHKSSLAVALPF